MVAVPLAPGVGIVPDVVVDPEVPGLLVLVSRPFDPELAGPELAEGLPIHVPGLDSIRYTSQSHFIQNFTEYFRLYIYIYIYI